MAIWGIGSDIVKVSRIEKILDRHRDSFLKRVYSEHEIDYAYARHRPALHLAARFAAKEAFVKALGLGIGKELSWRDVGVVNQSGGKPELAFSQRASVSLRQHNLTASLSLAHEQEFALAFVVLERSEQNIKAAGRVTSGVEGSEWNSIMESIFCWPVVKTVCLTCWRGCVRSISVASIVIS